MNHQEKKGMRSKMLSGKNARKKLLFEKKKTKLPTVNHHHPLTTRVHSKKHSAHAMSSGLRKWSHKWSCSVGGVSRIICSVRV